MLCSDLVDLTDDLSVLDGEGFWAVVLPSEGSPVCARFADVRPATPWTGRPWPGCDPASWTTTLGEAAFKSGVEEIKERIRAGGVYQVNLTRRLHAPIDVERPGVDVAALGAALAEGNPAPFSAVVRIPEAGVAVASASPELFLRRDGDVVRSSPIKGTAATRDGFLAKDRAENVMIVDLVRNDLGRVCRYGSVTVPGLCVAEEHPGLVHLVSTVEGRLSPGAGWPELIDATFPPGSVTGAPKIAACSVIAELEADARGPYCGAIGWVDADRRVGELNVAIRTFWMADDHLWFGTGGGITIDSTPHGEWAETELKADRLLRVASQPAREVQVGRT